MRMSDIMRYLPPVKEFPQITRQQFCDSMDEILNDIEKNRTAYVLTEEGKHDLLICPAEWFSCIFDDDFGLIVSAAVRYSIGRKTYMPRVISDFIKKNLYALSNKTLFNIKEDLGKGLNDKKTDQFDLWKDLQEIIESELRSRKETE